MHTRLRNFLAISIYGQWKPVFRPLTFNCGVDMPTAEHVHRSIFVSRGNKNILALQQVKIAIRVFFLRCRVGECWRKGRAAYQPTTKRSYRDFCLLSDCQCILRWGQGWRTSSPQREYQIFPLNEPHCQSYKSTGKELNTAQKYVLIDGLWFWCEHPFLFGWHLFASNGMVIVLT